MKIYIASNEVERTRMVANRLEQNGHTIVYKWYDQIENEKPEDIPRIAQEEREAIRESDALVYLWRSDQESARIEAGMAMGLGLPVIAVGNQEVFFFNLPDVYVVPSDDEAVKMVEAI